MLLFFTRTTIGALGTISNIFVFSFVFRKPVANDTTHTKNMPSATY